MAVKTTTTSTRWGDLLPKMSLLLLPHYLRDATSRDGAPVALGFVLLWYISYLSKKASPGENPGMLRLGIFEYTTIQQHRNAREVHVVKNSLSRSYYDDLAHTHAWSQARPPHHTHQHACLLERKGPSTTACIYMIYSRIHHERKKSAAPSASRGVPWPAPLLSGR